MPTTGCLEDKSQAHGFTELSGQAAKLARTKHNVSPLWDFPEARPLSYLCSVNPSPPASESFSGKTVLSGAWAAPALQGRYSKQFALCVNSGLRDPSHSRGKGGGPENQPLISQCGTPFWQSYQVRVSPVQPLLCRQPRTSQVSAVQLQASGKDRPVAPTQLLTPLPPLSLKRSLSIGLFLVPYPSLSH